jgi:hypothetical protein
MKLFKNDKGMHIQCRLLWVSIIVMVFMSMNCVSKKPGNKNTALQNKTINSANTNTVAETPKIKIDSIYFTWQSEGLMDKISISLDGKVYYNVIRAGGKKVKLNSKSIVNIEINEAVLVFDSIPAHLINAPDEGQQIGAPLQFDQGAYVFEMVSHNGKRSTSLIDANNKRWPADIIPYCNKLIKILMKARAANHSKG